MELVRGGELLDRIRLKKIFSEMEAVRITRQLISALHFLHSRFLYYVAAFNTSQQGAGSVCWVFEWRGIVATQFFLHNQKLCFLTNVIAFLNVINMYLLCNVRNYYLVSNKHFEWIAMEVGARNMMHEFWERCGFTATFRRILQNSPYQYSTIWGDIYRTSHHKELAHFSLWYQGYP